MLQSQKIKCLVLSRCPHSDPLLKMHLTIDLVFNMIFYNILIPLIFSTFNSNYCQCIFIILLYFTIFVTKDMYFLSYEE